MKTVTISQQLRLFRSHRLCCKKGITLMELLMTVIVVGIISIPLALLVSEHLPGTFRSSDYTMALDLAQQEIEHVKNMDYFSIVNNTFSSYMGYNYDVARIVGYVSGDEDTAESLKRVKVVVTNPQDADFSVSLVTYIARNINYGI